MLCFMCFATYAMIHNAMLHMLCFLCSATIAMLRCYATDAMLHVLYANVFEKALFVSVQVH